MRTPGLERVDNDAGESKLSITAEDASPGELVSMPSLKGLESGSVLSIGANSGRGTAKTAPRPLARQGAVILASVSLTLSVYLVLLLFLEDKRAFAILCLLGFIVFETLWNLVTAALAIVMPKTLHLNVEEIAEPNLYDYPRPPLVVPVILRSDADIKDALNCVRDIVFSPTQLEIDGIALLVDFADCPDEMQVSDDQFRQALERELSEIRAIAGPDLRVVPLYRRRAWNKFEERWMGWERKRGKIVEFLRHTRGLPSTFVTQCPREWLGCRYIMTIDVDTRLERGTVARLVAALENLDGVSIAAPTLETLPREKETIERWLIEPNFARPVSHEPKAAQLVYGCELFNGKGVVAVDQFLNSTSQIPENSVLSHDHLEALLSGACAVGSACVCEPFPETRIAWERRQHRWFRGDTQVLPWGINGRSWYKNDARRLSWQGRFTAARVALTPINHAIRYVAVLALSTISVSLSVATLMALVFFRRDGIADGLLSLIRARFNSYRNNSLFSNIIFYLGNSALRSIGEIIYFQRVAILAAHASILALLRMTRKSRCRLLEWYPDDPASVIRWRRLAEAALVALAIGTSMLSTEIQVTSVAIVAWWLVVTVISMLPPVPTTGAHSAAEVKRDLAQAKVSSRASFARS